MLQRPDTTKDQTRERVLALLLRFGWNATSCQILEPGYAYWFCGDEACVAYVDTGRAWVVAGAPIASAHRLTQVAEEFLLEAQRYHRRLVFFATEHRFAAASTMASMLIGQQPIWHPGEWDSIVGSVKSLRAQVRRSRSKQVVVRRVVPGLASPQSTLDRHAVQDLIIEWLGTRSTPALGFLVGLHPFSFSDERRYYVAWRAERCVGFAAIIPVYDRRGWFIEHLIRARDAPNGTVESLVDVTMRDAAASGCEFVTLGLAPLAGPVGAWLRAARRFGSVFYDFSGLAAFKAKFRPKEWCPIYLTYPKRQSGLVAVYDCLVAFAHGRLWLFALRTLLWGPSVVVRSLAILLVPWTLLIACADSDRWFPSPLVKWAWVVFDVGICSALLSMFTRFRRTLATVVIALIALDVVATLLEALLFNLRRVRHWTEFSILLTAVAAPALATIVLWNVRQRELRALADPYRMFERSKSPSRQGS